MTLTPAMHQKLYELLNAIAEKAYATGYKDGKAHSKPDAKKVRVSMVSIRRIK
jgi:hypothetical protein